MLSLKNISGSERDQWNIPILHHAAGGEKGWDHERAWRPLHHETDGT